MAMHLHRSGRESMSSLITRKRFTVSDFRQMARAGILAHDERVELVHGEILAMSPVGPLHGAAVARAARALIEATGDAAVVWIQSSTRLNDYNAPQPDIAVLKPRDDFYSSRLPEPQDMLLVIEISDSSLAYDRGVKAGLYAEAGIHECWVSDVSGDTLLVYSDPQSGSYRTCTKFGRGDAVSPGLLPGCELDAGILLAHRSSG